MYNEEPWQKSTYSVESHSWEEIQEEDRQVFREEAEVAVSAYLAALPAPRTITTVEDLGALPVGTILRDYAGLALHKRPTGTWWCTNGTTGLTDADLANEIEDTTYWYTVLWVPTEGGGE